METNKNKEKAADIAFKNAKPYVSLDLNELTNESSFAECKQSALNGIDWKEQQLTDWLLHNAEKYVRNGSLLLNEMIMDMLNDN